MERKKMIATAAAVLATVFSGSAAIAANLGILNNRQDPVGEFSPVADAVQIADVAPGDGTTTTLPVEVETVYVDEIVRPGATGTTAPTNAPTTVPKADDSTPEHQDDDDSDDDSDSDDGADHEDEREHEDEHEFEGHDDDD